MSAAPYLTQAEANVGDFCFVLFFFFCWGCVIFILSIEFSDARYLLGVESCSFVALIRDATRVGVDRRFSADSLCAGFIVYG